MIHSSFEVIFLYFLVRLFGSKECGTAERAYGKFVYSTLLPCTPCRSFPFAPRLKHPDIFLYTITGYHGGVAEESRPHACGAAVEWEVSGILKALRSLGIWAVTHRPTQHRISKIKCLKSSLDVFSDLDK